MNTESFYDKLTQRYQKTRSLLCIGLDPQAEHLIDEDINNLVTATKDYALAYIANVAYFEQFGLQGYIALEALRQQIPSDIPLILDAKRCDTGSAAIAYSKALYDKLHADAITVSGYLGADSIIPFADRADRGVFVVCKTSNSSANELQELITNGNPLYLHLADLVHGWNENHNIGLVVETTFQQELELVRKKCPEMWILAPAVGLQDNDLQNIIHAGLTQFGGLLITIDNSILQSQNLKTIIKDLVEQMQAIIYDTNFNLKQELVDPIEKCKHSWIRVQLDMQYPSCKRCGNYNGHHCLNCHVCYHCI